MSRDDNIYDDCWLYILLLSTLVILIESLRSYSFKLLGNQLSYSLLLLPVTYFLVNYICKKYDYKKAISAIALSAVLLVAFTVIMEFALGGVIDFTGISGICCGYVLSQFMNLTFYLFIINNTRQSYFLILFNYWFAIIIYSIVSVLLYLDKLVLLDFIRDYLLTLGLQFIIVIPLAFLDKKVLRGVEKKLV